MYSSATNCNNTTAEDSLSKSQWINWCRLCAKEDNKNNINFLYQNEEEEQSECYGSKKLSIQDALVKYFGVQTSSEDSLPIMLCPDCLSLVSFLISFNECVERVQLMYHYLVDFHTIADNYSCDLNSVRLNYGATEQARNQLFFNYAFSEEQDVDTESHYLENPESPQSSGGDTQRLEVQLNLENDLKLENLTDKDCVKKHDDTNDNSNDSYHEEEVEDSLESNQEETVNNSFSSEEESHTKCIQRDEVSSIPNPEKSTIKTSFVKDLKIDITCKECNENFTEYMTYRDHLQQNHNPKNNRKPWPCPLCDKRSYSVAHSLKQHIKAVHVQMIKCPECDRYYKSNAEIEEHIRYKHKKEKRFICEECGLALMNRTNLRKHMLRHTDIAPYECKICKSRFKNEERLKRHMGTHSSKRYICNICGLHLKSKVTFKSHFLVHSDKRKYKCDYCGKTFKISSSLKHHLLVHVGLRPYSCNFCERTFTTSYNCNLHVKKTHPNEYAERKALGNNVITNNMPKLATLKAITNNLINKKNEPST